MLASPRTEKLQMAGSGDVRGPRAGSPRGVLDSSASSAKRESQETRGFESLRRFADEMSALPAIGWLWHVGQLTQNPKNVKKV